MTDPITLPAPHRRIPGRFVSPEPKPTAFEAELLDCLAEECAEATQRACKIKRFGVREIQPGQDLTNAQRLAQEIGDVLGVVDLLVKAGVVFPYDIARSRRDKPRKLRKFLQADAPKGFWRR